MLRYSQASVHKSVQMQHLHLVERPCLGGKDDESSVQIRVVALDGQVSRRETDIHGTIGGRQAKRAVNRIYSSLACSPSKGWFPSWPGWIDRSAFLFRLSMVRRRDLATNAKHMCKQRCQRYERGSRRIFAIHCIVVFSLVAAATIDR